MAFALIAPGATADCRVETTPAVEQQTSVGLVYVVAPGYCWTGDLAVECDPWKPWVQCVDIPCLDSGGVYRESNGIPGLQRWWSERCGAAPDEVIVGVSDWVDLPDG